MARGLEDTSRFFLGIILVVTVGITGIYFYPTGNNNFNRLSPPPPPYLPSAPVVTPVSFTIQECTQSFNIEENKPFTFKIVDPDLNYTYSNIITVSRPENGTLGGINQTDGHITYTPKIGFNGSDRFLFRVSENRSDRNTADICLNIRPK